MNYATELEAQGAEQFPLASAVEEILRTVHILFAAKDKISDPLPHLRERLVALLPTRDKGLKKRLTLFATINPLPSQYCERVRALEYAALCNVCETCPAELDLREFMFKRCLERKSLSVSSLTPASADLSTLLCVLWKSAKRKLAPEGSEVGRAVNDTLMQVWRSVAADAQRGDDLRGLQVACSLVSSQPMRELYRIFDSDLERLGLGLGLGALTAERKSWLEHHKEYAGLVLEYYAAKEHIVELGARVTSMHVTPAVLNLFSPQSGLDVAKCIREFDVSGVFNPESIDRMYRRVGNVRCVIY
jgi:hypothetical protein